MFQHILELPLYISGILTIAIFVKKYKVERFQVWLGHNLLHSKGLQQILEELLSLICFQLSYFSSIKFLTIILIILDFIGINLWILFFLGYSIICYCVVNLIPTDEK